MSTPSIPDPPIATEPTLCRACGEVAVREVAWHASNFREGLEAEGDYCRCGACGTLNLVPLPTTEYLDSAYNELLAPPNPGAERSGLRALVRRLIPNPHDQPLNPPRPGARVLDIGCGNGGKLRIYQRAGWQCFGVDLSASGIEAARRATTGMHFHAGPVSSIPFERRTFDLVRSDNVVEHLLQPLLDLQAARPLLRPGGCIRIYVPSGTGLTVRLLHAGSTSSWVPFHVTLFSARGLRRLLEHAGFRGVRIEHYSPPHRLSASLRQVLGMRGWGPEAVERLIGALSPAYRPVAWLSSAARLGDELIATAFAP